MPNVRPPSSERPKNYVSRKGAHSESRIVRSPSPVNVSFPISKEELEEKLSLLREERNKKMTEQMDEYLNIEYDRLSTACIAQLVEHALSKRKVGGSIPPGGFFVYTI